MRLRAGVAVAALAVAFAARAADPDRYFEASVRRVREAVAPPREGSPRPLLLALRQLRDPALKPLFYQLVRAESWPLQVHAVLGLAEIEPEPQVDQWLVTQIAPAGREHLVANALDGGLLPPQRIEELLRWAGLEPMPRLLLIAELMLQGRAVATEPLEQLAADNDPAIAGFASCLLAQQQSSTDFLAPVIERAEAMPAVTRRRHLVWIMEILRQYELDRCAPLATAALERAEPDDALEHAALRALLAADPAAGLEHWRTRLGDAPDGARRLRFAVLLLEASESLPAPQAWDAIGGNEPVIRQVVEAGRALAGGADPVEPLLDLLAGGHALSGEWAMSRCSRLEPARAAEVYRRFADDVISGSAAVPESIDEASLAVRAVSRLAEIDLDEVLERLAAAEDDSDAQQLLLLALMDCRAPAVAAAAARLPRSAPNRADSMALLLVARGGQPLSDADRRALGVVAAGGGRVNEMLQAQAAWLYLRHTGRIDQALARIFSSTGRVE